MKVHPPDVPLPGQRVRRREEGNGQSHQQCDIERIVELTAPRQLPHFLDDDGAQPIAGTLEPVEEGPRPAHWMRPSVISMKRSSRPAPCALNSRTGNPAADQPADERDLVVIAAGELELQPPVRFVHVQHAGLFEQEPFGAVGRAGEPHRQDPPPAHALQDVLDRARGQDAALLDDGDEVAHLGELRQDVRAEENGLAVRRQLPNQRPEFDARARIEVRGRLVENQQLGIVNEGAAERDALLQALGQSLRHRDREARRYP